MAVSCEVALRPACPKGHGPMELRAKPDKLAVELGTWYDCRYEQGGPAGRCRCSHLLPAPWLAEQYAKARP